MTEFNDMFGGSPFDMGNEGKTEEATVVTQAPAVKAPNAVAPKGVPDDFQLEFPVGMEDAFSGVGVSVTDIGVKISKVPIDKYKASTQKVDRIGFLTKKVVPVKFHYIDGAGSVVCFGGKCCEIGGYASLRYVFPIAVYSTDNEGNVTGKKVELKALSAGEDLYKSIITISKGAEQYGGIDHIDCLVTCVDDKYQKITLTPTGKALWRQVPAMANYFKDRLLADGANIYMAIARKVDEASFLKLVGLEGSESASPSDKFDSSANTDLSKFFE